MSTERKSLQPTECKEELDSVLNCFFLGEEAENKDELVVIEQPKNVQQQSDEAQLVEE